jgi:asparagine synthase (glutamine-hydrolysing)
MSGILALVGDRLDAREPGRLDAMLAGLRGRGPAAAAMWSDGRAALGHALLGDGDPGLDASQPLTLDGRTWIVADARVDDRATLSTALGLSAIPSDAELLLRAYGKWGDGCLDRLIGDFAFAIWDGDARRLFCARDQLGIKPLYYASGDGWMAVGSTIDCMRRHPLVGEDLNELAIADFLLFGFNQDPATTTFRDILRLPPAHVLSWATGRTEIRRYWTLPIETPLHLRGDAAYVERLTALLEQSVRDRVRSAPAVGVFMSGGIDSTLLASASLDVLGPSGARRDGVHGFTFAYGTLIADTERDPASLAAASLGIPLHVYVLDATRGWTPPSAVHSTPEPAGLTTVTERRCYEEMAAHSRIGFYGEGPDNALVYEWRPYLASLLRRRRYAQLAGDLRRFMTQHRTVPLLGSARAWLRGRRGAGMSEFPAWIDPDFTRRLDLRGRWAAGHAPYESRHPVRPRAHASLVAPVWQSVFESMDPASTGVALDIRHPYLDLRLLRFLLRVPVIPWCRNKHLLRLALHGRVPEAVRRRPKTPLSGRPDAARVRRDGWPDLAHTRAVEPFGSLEAVARQPPSEAGDVEGALRLVALAHWLDRLGPRRHPSLR